MSLTASRRQAHPPKVVQTSNASKDGVSESGRYECESCERFFCIDCDVFAHEVVHNCPGCQSREELLTSRSGKGEREMLVEEGDDDDRR